ncbi:MAG: DMT family transporter [Parvularculales bacterium]
MSAKGARLSLRLRIGRRAFEKLPGNVRGAIWLLMSAVLFTVMTILVKHIGGRLGVFQVAFFRALFSLLVILPFLIRVGFADGGIRTHYPVLQIVRGIVGSVGMICGFYAVIHLPLADAQAFSFARALFVVPLAWLILREVAGLPRIAATLVGFAGVLIMLRPGTETITDPAAPVAVGGAALVALAVILVKIVSHRDQPVTLMFYTGVVGSLVTIGPALWAWVAPTIWELVLLLAMGTVAAGAHNCFIRAYRAGEPTAIAPFDYTRLLFAAIAGYFFFSTFPDFWIVSGACLIVGSTFYIVRHEAQTATQNTQPPTDKQREDTHHEIR